MVSIYDLYPHKNNFSQIEYFNSIKLNFMIITNNNDLLVHLLFLKVRISVFRIQSQKFIWHVEALSSTRCNVTLIKLARSSLPSPLTKLSVFIRNKSLTKPTGRRWCIHSYVQCSLSRVEIQMLHFTLHYATRRTPHCSVLINLS